jgi:hypothetical protein
MALLADMTLPAKNFGLQSERTEAADTFVLITLAFLFFVLGIGLVSAWLLWRRQTRPQPHVQLMMELEQQHTIPQLSSTPNTLSPWEKDPDWWKQEEKDDAV